MAGEKLTPTTARRVVRALVTHAVEIGRCREQLTRTVHGTFQSDNLVYVIKEREQHVASLEQLLLEKLGAVEVTNG